MIETGPVTKDENGRTCFTYFSNIGDVNSRNAYEIIQKIIEIVSTNIANEYLKQNKQEIIKKLDSQAVLNLALAKSAAKVFDDIKSNR